MSNPASSETKGRGRRRLVLITGASAGIGAAFASAYAKRSYDLALVARRADRLEALAGRLATSHGIEAFAIPADLSLFEGHAPVLDVNGKAHELDNLYVVDSSFFVISAAVSPTLTIVADAVRVGDHLKKRLGA